MIKENDHERLAELIRDIQFAMLTTLNSQDELHSRPMVTLEGSVGKVFDGVLWFFTHLDSLMVKDIQRNKAVNVAYANPDAQRYISLSGVAEISQDPVKMQELWNESLRNWFPKGLTENDLALIKIEVTSAEIWDEPVGRVMQIMGKAKSMLTGKPYESRAQNNHIDFRTH